MLNRDTDLTERRLFHSKIELSHSNKALSYLKLNLFGYHDFVNLDSLFFTRQDDGFLFQVFLTKIGLIKNERYKYVSKPSERYCDKCGREFNILGRIDKRKYCIPSDTSSLCVDCDRELSQEVGTQKLIEKVLKIKEL